MSKYSEALEMFCNATAVFREENGKLVMVAYNDNLRQETSILEEAIEKAEKYDEVEPYIPTIKEHDIRDYVLYLQGKIEDYSKIKAMLEEIENEE